MQCISDQTYEKIQKQLVALEGWVAKSFGPKQRHWAILKP